MLLRSSFLLLCSNFSFPRGRVMIFILVFGMTMRTFAWANMGSLRSHLIEPKLVYYAMTTQKSFFDPKKTVFFSHYAIFFYHRNVIFCVFFDY
jgi:hypothetical protein